MLSLFALNQATKKQLYADRFINSFTVLSDKIPALCIHYDFD